MYCIDNQCSTPFHIVIADLIECFGGSAELVKFLNRFGVCVSYDTLLRHIQEKVEEEEQKGLLLGLTPDGITVEPLNADPLRCGPLVYPATHLRS